MAMTGMPCIRVMQNGRAVCIDARCVLCVAHLCGGRSHPHSLWAQFMVALGTPCCSACWCSCGVVWCGAVRCGVVWCGVVWCGVVWCGVVWCAEGAVTRRQRPGCLPTGTGKRAGLCLLRARRVYVCRSWRGEGGSREDLVSTPLAAVLTPGAPAALPLAPLVGVGVAPAVPTPSCCPGPGGPSAAKHAPWRGRTRPVWTPR